jgi:hypothetical protein
MSTEYRKNVVSYTSGPALPVLFVSPKPEPDATAETAGQRER